jgi:hypothetical protein
VCHAKDQRAQQVNHIGPEHAVLPFRYD